MKQTIWALEYLCSTDEMFKKQLDKCPPGTDSWCEYRKYEAAGKLGKYRHSPWLHPDIEKHLISIYIDLSNDLLTWCFSGHRMRTRASIRPSGEWHRSIQLNYDLKIISIAAFIAAGVFNEDYSLILKMMNELDINIGPECRYFADIYRVLPQPTHQ